ncbi:hypothetical protein [Desulfonatronovibrio hydrogenovorans]|uniref:hypothetical protein n=1 Tax=Desulfonatronovibrio hydrogenovorans TaxID=53245 RepID=UPI00123737E0|nr:hypothetical protein [Desulfonatronovibrio hydrogenovorans]
MNLILYRSAKELPLLTGLGVANAKLALMANTYVPDLEHSEWSDLSAHEINPSPGYEAGGKIIDGTIKQSGNKYQWQPSDTVFSALQATFAYGVLYSGLSLIGYIAFSEGNTITITGYDFVIKWAAPGIIELEVVE